MTLRSKLNTVFGLILLAGFSLLTSVILQQTRSQLEGEITDRVAQALDDSLWVLEMSDNLDSGSDLNSVIYTSLEDLLSGRRYLTHVEVSFRRGLEEPSHFTIPLLPSPKGLAQDPPDHVMPPSPNQYHQTRRIVRPDLAIEVTIFGDISLAIRFQKRLLTIVISLALSILILSLLLTSALTARLLTSPLNRLRHLTTKVAAGDLTVVTPWSLRSRYDELGVLANAFAAMVDNLREAREEKEALLNQMTVFNQELEDRIRYATRQLGHKNRELESANADLIEVREELTRQERFAALGQLAGSIAHEIGTPLSTISGHLQLLLLLEEMSPEGKEAVEVARTEVSRMTETIRRLLSSTRGVTPAREPVELTPFLTQVIQLTFPPCQSPLHTVDTYIDARATMPTTDPGLLRQLLINLLTNARDAMERGGRLVLEAQRDGDSLVLHIDDSGPGVPESLRSDIFEAFFTSKEPEKGTGLGLPICKEIARALRGSLRVSDSPEGGARFTLKIPAWDHENEGAE